MRITQPCWFFLRDESLLLEIGAIHGVVVIRFMMKQTERPSREHLKIAFREL